MPVMLHREEFGYTEFTTDPLYGYRAFRLKDNSLHPVALFDADPWHPGVNLATCGGASEDLPCLHPDVPNHQRHQQPGWSYCVCGFYSYHTPVGSTFIELAITLAEIRLRYNPSEVSEVAAVVQNTGNIILGTKGMRAEKSEIVALIVPGYKIIPAPNPLWYKFVKRWEKASSTIFALFAAAFLLAGILTAFNIIESFPILIYAMLALILTQAAYLALTIFFPVDNHRGTRRQFFMRMDGVAKKYNVPIYSSVEDAMKVYPPVLYEVSE